MKKLLLAIAAVLMISGAAHAQSDENIYLLYEGFMSVVSGEPLRMTEQPLSLMILEGQGPEFQVTINEQGHSPCQNLLSRKTGELKLCSGRVLKFMVLEGPDRLESLGFGKTSSAIVLESSGRPNGGSVVLNLIGTQWGLQDGR